MTAPSQHPTGAEAASEHQRFHRYHAWRARLAANPALNATWRLSVLAVGTAIVLAGVAMLVLPGPGWAAIFIGLAILGTEYHWARRLLMWARARVTRVAERALDPRVRRRNQLIFLAIIVTVVGGCTWYVAAEGVPDAVLDLTVR